jgi:type IV pilus assembly protein PilN
MIKINLLGVERPKVRKKIAFPVGQRLTIGCSLILILAALGIGWRYWSLAAQSAKLDADIATAQGETARLHSIIVQVQQYEQQKAQLQQRVALIEQLRREQTGPVHMLDEISRALPAMVWLTDLKQNATGEQVEIDGKCLSETAVSDFVANLEASGYFKKSIDIASTTTETTPQPPGELVTFSLKAIFQQPVASATPAAAAPPAGKPPTTGVGN